MADEYIYHLSSGIKIKVLDNWGPINEWEEIGDSGKLIITGGTLESTVPPKVCTSAPLANPQPVVTLHGASWDSKVGDSGQATVHLATGTPTQQTWNLVSKS